MKVSLEVQIEIRECKFYVNLVNIMFYLDYSSWSQQQLHSDVCSECIEATDILRNLHCQTKL